MNFLNLSRTGLGLTTAVSVLVLQAVPAFAFEPTGNDIADAFLSLLDAEEGSVQSYASVDTTGDTVTLTNIVLNSEGEDDGQVTIGTTSLSGGAILDGGKLKLNALDLSDLVLDADDGGMTLKTMAVTDLLLPSAEDLASGAPATDPSYKSLEILTVEIKDENGKVADIEKITSSIDSMDGDQPTSGQFSVTGATIDVKAIEAEEAKSLSDLGYETLSLNINGSGKWEPDAGTLNVPELKIDGENVAALTVSLSLGGVTREVVDQLNQATDNPEEAMALLQGISISNIKIRLDDASVTARILDQEAEKAGVDRSQYIAGLTSSLPLMLGMLQNKELEGQVAEAVSTYLNNPSSLQVVAAPSAPVPMAQIMGTAMIAPQMIPQILSLAITANQ